MRRFLLQALASMGVLTALAVLDLGPRATAAYLSLASRQAGAGFEGGMCEDDGSDSLPKNDREVLYHHACPNPEINLGGGIGTVPSQPTSSSHLVAADLVPVKPPTACLVIFLREPPGSLHLCAIIDSLIDPPRVV